MEGPETADGDELNYSMTKETLSMEQHVAALHQTGTELQSYLRVFEQDRSSLGASDFQAAAHMMLGFMGAELVISAADDFHFNRPAAGCVVGRAILETAVVLRWALTSKSNATRWWQAGDTQIQKVLRASRMSDDPDVTAFREAPALKTSLPSVQSMAVAGGLEAPYRTMYPALSAYAHANRMSTVHMFSKRGQAPIQPPIVPILYFAHDIATVVGSWAEHQEVAPAWPFPSRRPPGRKNRGSDRGGGPK